MNAERLIKELVRDECKDQKNPDLKVYHDSKGLETIGVGRNLRGKGISREEAYHLLNNDIEEVVVDLDQHLPWWRKLDEVRQRVLANMRFNMGHETFFTFHNTLLLIQLGKYDEAATHVLTLPWATQTGTRAIRLAAMLATGKEHGDD